MLCRGVPLVGFVFSGEKEAPGVDVFDVTEFYWVPLAGCFLKDVISSLWVVFVVWFVKNSFALDVGWEIVFPSSVDSFGGVGEFPYDELCCQDVCVFASTMFEASR